MIRDLLDEFFYRRLWLKAEADRRAADADRRSAEIANREMAIHVLDLLEALDIDEHPSARVRGAARKLRRAVEVGEGRP